MTTTPTTETEPTETPPDPSKATGWCTGCGHAREVHVPGGCDGIHVVGIPNIAGADVPCKCVGFTDRSSPPPITSTQTEPLERDERVEAAMDRWKEAAGDADMEVYRPSLMPSVATWDQITRVANELSKAVALPAALRGRPSDIALVLLVGRDVGVGPTTALNKIYVIDGKPSMAPELMRALIIDRGHDVWFEDVSDTSVTICGHRSTWPVERVSRVTWTLETAKRAKLIKDYDAATGAVTPQEKKEVWAKYTRNMLKARATSELGRDDFPDVLLGVSYTPEELDADVDEAGIPLRVDSWSENAADAPTYQPAPQRILDAFLKDVDAMEPAAKAIVAAKWKELKLRPLRPTEHFPDVLSIDEISLAEVAIAEALRTAPADAEVLDGEIVQESSDGEDAPESGDAEPPAQEQAGATERALAQVDDLNATLERTDAARAPDPAELEDRRLALVASVVEWVKGLTLTKVNEQLRVRGWSDQGPPKRVRETLVDGFVAIAEGRIVDPVLCKTCAGYELAPPPFLDDAKRCECPI